MLCSTLKPPNGGEGKYNIEFLCKSTITANYIFISDHYKKPPNGGT